MSSAERPPRGRRLTQLGRLPVTELRGVGEARARALGVLGIESVLDVVTFYPRRWVDRSHPTDIAACDPGEEALVTGTVEWVRSRTARNRRPVVDARLTDGTGRLVLTFFNQPYRRDQLREGDEVTVFGKVEHYRSKLTMTNPILDLAGDETGAIIPIYPQSQKARVSSRDLRRHITEALARAGEFADPLPATYRRSLGLIGRTEAFRRIHAPDRFAEIEGARRRLAFDELWRLECTLVLRKAAEAAAARGVAHHGGDVLVDAFLERLPFALTGAQRRVLTEIAHDLAAETPMHRLLQGDVGSGKTVVALATLLYGIGGGTQGALMVPTEVLAVQHFAAARRLLADLEVDDDAVLGGRRALRAELLTSDSPARARQRVLDGLAAGDVDLVVGTHALLTEAVRFRRLGVAVIDEQHRFGVDQRAALREKGGDGDGRDPDLLVMTATPIPRTAAMTVYGDLDYSELDELPAGREPVATRWIADRDGGEPVWARVRAEVAAGNRAFVVCPRVHAADEVDETDAEGLWYFDEDAEQLFAAAPTSAGAARAVVEEFDRLRATELAGLRLGLVHGSLAADAQEEVMAAFTSGAIDVLVATTVVEVGVDVPEATVMVIEDADHFGIAQLHQLRGRVGRGERPGYCFLLAADVSEDGRRRLEAMVATTNGFELAEVDLDLRGEGTVLGSRQKGRNDLRLASLRRDRALVAEARAVALEMVADDPGLAGHQEVRDELALFVDEASAEYLGRS